MGGMPKKAPSCVSLIRVRTHARSAAIYLAIRQPAAVTPKPLSSSGPRRSALERVTARPPRSWRAPAAEVAALNSEQAAATSSTLGHLATYRYLR